MGSTMVSTLIYLKDSQKKRLKTLAKAKRTSLAEEVRNAVEQYLSSGQVGITQEDLDVLVTQAKVSIKGMVDELDETLTYANAILKKIEKRESGRKGHN